MTGPTIQANQTVQLRAAPSAAAGGDPVAAAATEIGRRLEGTGMFGQGTTDDSKAILDQFRSLSDSDASRLTQTLAKAGKLDDVARMTTDSTMMIGDGVSVDDRRSFFADMAGKLDGAASAKMSQAFGSVDRGDGKPGGRPDGVAGADYAREYGRAVATHAPAADRVSFVRALASSTTEAGHQTQFAPSFGGGSVQTGNAQAGAVGEVLGSLRGRDAQSAFAGLNGDQMKAVYAASVDKNVSMTGGARVGGGQSGVNTNITYDTRGYDRIAVAAASVPDAHVKAQVFAAGTQTIRDTRIDNTVLARMTGISPESSQGAVARMGNSLARIIDSNPQAVVADLSNFDAKGRAGAISTDGGTPLATYAKAMIQSGAEGRGRLGAQLGMIAAGDGRQANATATFNHQVNERYQTATSLGYFAGAVASASKAIDTDVAAQRELLTGVLQSGLSIVDKGVGNNPMAAIAKDWLGTAMGSLIDNPASDVASVLADAATPTENGYRTDRSAPFSAFEAKLGEVMREALP